MTTETSLRIDAHQHFWKVSRGDYFWMGPEVAPLCRDYMPDDLEPELESHGIDCTVVVQAAPTIAETEFLLGLAERHARIAGVVGWVDLQSAELESELARLTRDPKLVGIRPMLQDLPEVGWIARPDVLESLGVVARSGLAFDFLVYPRHLPHVVRALERVPELRAVVDHAAKPALRNRDLDVWREGLGAVASHPNVYCKLSGLVTEADVTSWHPSDLAPAVEHVWRVFGEDRVVFGSDWPVCTLAASYGQVLGALREVLGGRLSPEQNAKLFGLNAVKLYALRVGQR